MSLDSWKDAVVYFVLIDRFCNGDRSNDDQGAGEFDPGDDDCFHGGDLAGLRSRLPFIQAMGYDAIWITPPVHNQWVNPYVKARGYHGYWAYDFTRVDPHFGGLDDYKALVDDAHRRGIRVIQDIVVNHTGNYFTVDAAAYDPKDPAKGWRPSGAKPSAPNDAVFRMNDPRRKEHRDAGVYNFTPNIADFKDRKQTLTWTMGDLDDINLDSPRAVERLKEIYRYWIDAVGVDGFRVDTVFYTPPRFYKKFLYDADGIKPHAATRGKPDFLVFGEIWSQDYAEIMPYVGGKSKGRLDSAIDHPLNEALTKVFFRGAATETLAAALTLKRPQSGLWVNFLDNHDVERVASRSDAAGVRQALAALFTIPGIPCVSYGTEASFTRSRQDMFEEAHYDLSQPAAEWLRAFIRLRKSDPVFTSGALSIERSSPSCGVLAYRLTKGAQSRLVVFNTASHPVFYEPPAGRRATLLGSQACPASGCVVIEPKGFLILSVEAKAGKREGASFPLRAPARPAAGKVPIAADLPKGMRPERLWLLVDDDHETRRALPASGKLKLDTTSVPNGRHELRVVAEMPGGAAAVSRPALLTVANPYRLLDERGPSGKSGLGARVHPPADPSYGGQLSLESAAAYTSGRDLRLVARMAEVSDTWNPPHGFDHVYFNVFLDFPGRPGKRFFPKLGHAEPDFEFNLGFMLYGWDTKAFSSEGATPDALGLAARGEVEYAVDRARRSIAFTFSAAFFRGLESFTGTKIWLSTWDGYLGEPRDVARRREDWNFYILEPASSKAPPPPKVFDHAILRL